MLFLLEHLSVDGDFCIQRLFGVQQTLQLGDLNNHRLIFLYALVKQELKMPTNQGLAILPHESESSVTLAEFFLVLTLVFSEIVIVIKISLIRVRLCEVKYLSCMSSL